MGSLAVAAVAVSLSVCVRMCDLLSIQKFSLSFVQLNLRKWCEVHRPRRAWNLDDREEKNKQNKQKLNKMIIATGFGLQ